MGAIAEIKNRDKQEEELISQIESYYNQGKKSLAEGDFLSAIVKFNHVIKMEKDLCIVYTPYAEQYIRQAKERIEEKEGADLESTEKKVKEEQKEAGQENSGMLEYTIGEGDELYVSVWQEEKSERGSNRASGRKDIFSFGWRYPCRGIDLFSTK